MILIVLSCQWNVSGGKIAIWGSSGSTWAQTPSVNSNFVSVSAGTSHTLALRADGTVVNWGKYNGTMGPAATCWIPDGLSNVVAIAAGHEFDVALKADGTLSVWGQPPSEMYSMPAIATNVTAISAGLYHTLGLREDGTIVGGGLNIMGICDVPAEISNVVAISAGQWHSLVLQKDGLVVAWGENSDGACSVPSNLSNVVAVSAGYRHSLALKADGTVAAWGINGAGQCHVPAGLSNVVAISAGWEYSAALRGDGSLAVWGNVPGYLQCDAQTGICSGISNVTEIAAGMSHLTTVIEDSPKNWPPVTRPKLIGTWRNQTCTLEITSLLAEACRDPNNDVLAFTLLSPNSTTGGQVNRVDDRITFTPLAGMTGTDSFSYEVQDSSGAKSQGVVNVNILAPEGQTLKMHSITLEGTKTTVRLLGVPHQWYYLESSENLKDWSFIGQATAKPDGLIEYIDNSETAASGRYYRGAF